MWTPAWVSASILEAAVPARALNDRARVAETSSGGGVTADDQRDNRLDTVGADPRRRLLLAVAADFAQQDDDLGFRVLLIGFDRIALGEAPDRSAAQSDDRRLAEPASERVLPTS